MKRKIENAVWLGWMMTAAAVILLTVIPEGVEKVKSVIEQKIRAAEK